jgi:hypothetical protein
MELTPSPHLSIHPSICQSRNLPGILQLWRNIPRFVQLLQPRLAELMDPLRDMALAQRLRAKLGAPKPLRSPAALLRGLLPNTAEMSSEALSQLVMALRNVVKRWSFWEVGVG